MIFLKRRGVLIFAALLVFVIPHASRAQEVHERRLVETSSAPVTLGGRVVLVLRRPLLSLSVADRAQRAGARLERAAGSIFSPLAEVKTIAGETSTDVAAGELILFSVTDADAAAVGQDREELAREDAAAVRSALAAHKRERSFKELAVDALFALLITALFALCLGLLDKFFKRTLPAIDEWARRRAPTLRIQSMEIIATARVYDGIRKFAGLFRGALTAAAIYLYATSVMSLFPWTQGLAGHLLGYILDPLMLTLSSLVGFIPNFFFIAVVVTVVRYGLKLVDLIFKEIEAGRLVFTGFYREWAEPTYEILRFLVWAFAVVVVFPYLPGSSSPAFKGISVFVGILLSFGSSSAISNIIAGVILTYMRPFKIGDRVKVADTVGDVAEKTLLVTRVRSIKNVDVTIPNAIVLSTHIINYSSSAKNSGLILNTTVTIGYDAPWRKVHELLIAAAESTEFVLKEPRPFVYQTALDDFFVAYEINAYTNEPNRMADTYSRLHQAIQDKFNEAGVEIMSPHYSSLRDGNRTTIPRGYLPGSYVAPAFRVNDGE
jgi:small-conductance mechanosensitive channel